MRHKAFYEDASGIDGSGCFVMGNWFGGDSIKIEGYPRVNESKYTVETEDGIFGIQMPFSLMNHSDWPNAYLEQIDDETFELTLMHDVADGEEITIHYGEEWE